MEIMKDLNDKAVKIGVMLPFKKRDKDFIAYNKETFSPEADILMLSHGDRAKETPVDAAITLPEQIHVMKEVEQDEYDGILVGCYLDPGVEEARGLCDITICGTAELSLRVCQMTGRRTGILTTSPYALRGIEANLRKWGLAGNVTVSCMDISVEEVLNGNSKELAKKIADKLMDMILNEDIQAATFGSGAMYRVYEEVKDELRRRGCVMPVINSSRCAFEMMKILVRSGLKQSRITYPRHGNGKRVK